MAVKYYRVIKENFLWKVGAIVQKDVVRSEHYSPIDNSDLWSEVEVEHSEHISGKVVENSPKYFERVYPVNLLTKTVYKAKKEALEMISNDFK